MQLHSPTLWSKRVVYPISFIYVFRTFEHQVQNSYASQKVQVSSTLRKPETDIRHEQVHQQTPLKSLQTQQLQ